MRDPFGPLPSPFIMGRALALSARYSEGVLTLYAEGTLCSALLNFPQGKVYPLIWTGYIDIFRARAFQR